MNTIINNLKILFKPKSKLNRLEKSKRLTNRLMNFSFVAMIIFELSFFLSSVLNKNWFSSLITLTALMFICYLTYKFNVKKPFLDKFLEEQANLRTAAFVSLMGQDPLLDWNNMSLEAMVTYLEEKYKFDNSGDGKCILSLIEFYDKHKEVEKETLN